MQNYPVFSGITSTSSARTLEGEISSKANTEYILDFYASSEVDPSGYGEGETGLASLTVHTDGAGVAPFSYPLDASMTGKFITATATDPGRNTSDFSLASEAIPGASRFLNISTRLNVGTGDNVLTGGFIIDGTEAKEAIIRAVGSSLGDFGVADPLPTRSWNCITRMGRQS